jgi:hypothetical protein
MRRFPWQIACAASIAGLVVFFAMGAGQSPEPKAPAYEVKFVAAKFTTPPAPREAETTPDVEKLRADVEKEISGLTKKGFEILQVLPIEKGVYRWGWEQTKESQNAASAYGFGYGFGVTGGVMIVAVRH